MKKKETNSQSAFLYLRVSIGVLLVLAGVALTLLGIGKFSAQAQSKNNAATTSINPLVPAGFDCAQLRSLGINVQENLRAGAIMIFCGEAVGGSEESEEAAPSFVEQLLAPLLGGTDVDLITPGPEAGTHITQSETFAAANPNNPDEIVVAYNDSRGVFANPINISGASVSTDGGTTFTRLTRATGQSPFSNTFGDPVALYNSPTGTWFTVWLDAACGGQGLGGYKTTTPANPDSWTHFCVHTGSADDRESGFADNSPGSPFFGRMYVSWNNFADGGSLRVRYSTDNGLTWTNERQLAPASPFSRNVQITGDPTNGNVYVASMNEMNGGLTNRANKFYKSIDGGNTWNLVNTGPTFAGPGRTVCPNTYFACMFGTSSSNGYWRHMGWGQPAVLNNVVHYVYDSRNTANGDPADTFYIRSSDGGVTFSAPFKLNTDTTTKAQWQPNLSIAADNSLLAVWYDEREATQTCVKGNTGIPCYRMWARNSTDGGLTWGANEPFSDVVTPLPTQPDAGIITEYAGDYDYSNSVLNQHLHPWTDGRVAVNNQSQQDAFFDQHGGGGGGGITLMATLEQRNGESRVVLDWTGTDLTGNIDVLRNGVVKQVTPDDGSTKDKLGTHTGTFTYQVCETDSGDCSNEVVVQVQ